MPDNTAKRCPLQFPDDVTVPGDAFDWWHTNNSSCQPAKVAEHYSWRDLLELIGEEEEMNSGDCHWITRADCEIPVAMVVCLTGFPPKIVLE